MSIKRMTWKENLSSSRVPCTRPEPSGEEDYGPRPQEYFYKDIQGVSKRKRETLWCTQRPHRLQLRDTKGPQNHWDYCRIHTFRKARNLYQSREAIFLKKMPDTAARMNEVPVPIFLKHLREGKVHRGKPRANRLMITQATPPGTPRQLGEDFVGSRGWC